MKIIRLLLTSSIHVPAAFGRGSAACVLCIALLLSGCGGGGGDDEGEVPLSIDACSVLGLKVFQGSVCTVTERSPVVKVLIDSLGGTSLCSGTLITPNHVLTAGHCFAAEGREAVSVTVVAEGRNIRSSSFTVHPAYSERVDLSAIFGDVAVVKLDESLSIPPLPILLSREVLAGDVINIFGFGLDEQGGLGVLQSGQMQLTEVTQTHLFSFFDGDGSNTCVGDSGGPALEAAGGGQALVGVTSTGSPNALCRTGDNSLFINLQDPAIIEFILQIAPSTGIV